MSRIPLSALLLLLVFSCRQHNNYSGDHLPKEVMQQLMLDVNIAEAYSISTKDSLHRSGSKNIDSLSVFYSRIFAHYKITEAEFNTSLEWYKNHPEELDTIYAHILPLASKMQAEAPPAKAPMPTPLPPQPLPPPGPARTSAPAGTHLSIIHTGKPKEEKQKPKVSADNTNTN